MIPTLYHLLAYRYDGYRVMTNKPACGAMRGHVVPQVREVVGIALLDPPYWLGLFYGFA